MELLTLIILLAIVALLLFAIEALLTPGLGIAGICGAACAIIANILAFIRYGNAIGMAVLGGTVVVVVGFLYWLSRSRAIERATLHSTISSTAATPAQLSINVGDEGHAVTRLALIGNAVIEGKTVEVKSADGFIDEGTPIVVTHVEEALILVRRKNEQTV